MAPEGYNDQKDTEAMVKFHLRAMDEQLVQVRWRRAHWRVLRATPGCSLGCDTQRILAAAHACRCTA